MERNSRSGGGPYWALRLGAAACFIGHGAFGIITKDAWVPYFALVGIPRDWAFTLMPIVGTVDIIAGLSVLFAPHRYVLVYMSVWALWTAMLRPLTGEPFAETLERAGNYGVPLAFFLLTRVKTDFQWVFRTLTVTTALLLVGHGVLAASGKPLLATHAAFAGLPPSALTFVGYAEIAAALLVLTRPSAPLLFAIAAWKIGTEALFPLTGAPLWEFIERGGSYAAPIALGLMLLSQSQPFRLLTPRRIS
jgi:hypothetical protein